ncbi:MAG: hypothetical protein KAX49_03545 [Halanaerobiales bacterium]|nr:hypothetical protein [Halanaerobiales bacterium]
MKNSKKRKLREVNYLLRKVRRRLKRRRRYKVREKHKIVKRKILYSELLKFLYERDFTKKSTISKSEIANIRIPKKFSFSENPNGTIHVLTELLYYGIEPLINGIHFDHTNCEELGICASTVMDVILLEINKNNRKLRNEYEISGEMPKNEKIKDILEASGIIRHLGFEIQEKKHIKELPLIVGDNKKYISGDVATKVIDFYMQCLETQSLILSKIGKLKMSHIIGEVIDNCQLHGGQFTKWYTLGHYHQFDEKNKNYGECHLVIFNFGDTIYENLKSSAPKELLDSLKNMTKKHVSYFRKNWKEESLWTLYALQEGVSRLRDKKSAPDRGTGTMKLINSFQEIGKTIDGELPIMSITSGRAHIYFDNKYRMMKNNNEDRYVIAFNKNNDLNKPPDYNNVKMLDEYFPGTVISLKFYIDKKYIQDKLESEGV